MSTWVYIAICCAVLVAKVQGTYDDGYEYAEPPCSECGDTSSSPDEASAVAAATATSTGTSSTATAVATSWATSETTAEPPCSECGDTSSSTAEASAGATATATSTGTTSTATAVATSATTSETTDEDCLRCGKNEVEACVKSCPPERTCRNRFILYSCINDPRPCTKKCICAEGYYRNSIGECITAAQCDQCKKPNEFYACNGACDNECINIGTQNRTHCPIQTYVCVEKCYCDDGYARDADGNCIPVDKCKPPTLNCGPHQVEQCVKRCPPEKTCRNQYLAVRCAQDCQPCTKKCVCEEGYLKNAIGQCITKAQCDQCKKPNEFYSCGSACDNECDKIWKQNRTNCPIINKKCNEMCYCDDGYARDGDGNCIPVDQCKRCGLNEEQRCVPSCPPERTCSHRNIQYECQGNLPCITKCVCKKGYFRNANGQCITKAQCDKCKKPNEFYACGGACDNECINIDSQNRTHCPKINIKCNEKCYCVDGYARDADGNCIPVDKCKPPALQCGPHEVEQCVKRCPPEKTCRNQNIEVPCAYDKRPCMKKCVCEKGYFRNALGQCITKAQCDKCKKPNEFYACDSACDNECINIDCQNRTNCPIINIKCNEKCYCDDGYARDGDGNCIPVDQCKQCGLNEEQRCVTSCPPERTCSNRNIQYKCQSNLTCTTKCVCKKGYLRNAKGQCITEAQCEPPILQCGPHEVVQCVNRCPPEKTCRNQNLAVRCAPDKRPCMKKCVCEKGYFRNAIGQCITKAQCDKCKKKNEFYACDSAYDNECINIASQNRTNCPIKNIQCNKKCYCDNGYARDGDGNCIPVDKCKRCRLNEEQRCVTSCPPERTCSNRNIQYKCQGNLTCTTKCVCKKGYFRNANGECITEAQCEPPTLQCGPHEVVQCVNRCPPEKTCRNQNLAVRCAPDKRPCMKKCVCEKGYFRNAIGQCITKAQCDKCKKKNEFYACDSACDNECINIASQNRTNCPIKNIQCNKKCYCDDGYARDGDGNCIPVDKCKRCGLNEEQRCVTSCPPERTCSNRNIQYKCQGNLTCTTKCVCKKGYFRNANGECITEAQCEPPTPQCGPHEVIQCVNRCPPEKTCRNRNLAVRCAPDKRPCTKKCVCEKGYFRNAIGQCITKAHCDKCKKKNEFYACDSACDNECINIASQNRTNCPIKNIQCNKKCYCDDGYARDGDGNCIPVDKCKPPTLQCGPHEVVQCVKRCPPEKTCRNRNLAVRCAPDKRPCKKKCVCEKGYFRNAIGQCITKAQCDKCKKKNEFYACDSACDNECINIASQNRTNCPIKNIQCNKKCYCDDGYARDGDGNCIPVDKCKRCGLNEEQRCVTSCPPERTCRNRNIQYKCQGKLPCITKCVCKKGYFRNVNGQCITQAQCDKCKKPNEFYDCGSACDNECININTRNRTYCPIINIKCNEKCYCVDGYARDADGNCIPVDKCKPPTLQCGPHEVQQCVKRCPPEKTCRNQNLAVRCAYDKRPCMEKCVCEKGYFRNAIGQCITKAQCDKCKKPNEFYACGGACDNECINIDTRNRTYCPIINIKCNEKCYCVDGYARDADGNCIPVDKCKPPTLQCGPHEVQQCVKRCPPEKTCRNQNLAVRCAYDKRTCMEKCVCEKGYFRNAIGQCITKAQCDKCKKPNEFYACGGACDNECINIDTRNRTYCPIINIKCNEKCYCVDGYARDADGNCIPVDKCKRCGPNEVQRCVSSCPPEGTCRNRNAKYLCKSNLRCTTKCVCAEGYYRNSIGECITGQQCDQCNKTHEFYSCGSACDNECINIDTQNRKKCPIINIKCNEKCYCDDGYARDGNGKCVPADLCKKCSCKQNEVYVQEKRSCPPEICRSMVARYDCSKAPPPKPGCACKSGYLRLSETSPCIPICKCPEIANTLECQNKTCGLNEEYVEEKPSCPPEICGSMVARYDCRNAPPPKPGCACKSGYLRHNETSPCMPICKCPEIANTLECLNKTCGLYEEYVEEKQSCPPEICRSMVARYDCRNAPPPKPGCACKSGYLRHNETSPCMPICKCPEIANTLECLNKTCGLYEEYVEEKQSCPPEICRSMVARYDCRNAPPPKPGCACKSGYLRHNETSPCMPICKCPEIANTLECLNKTCGLYEEYVEEKKSCPPEICRSMVARYDCRNAPPPKPGCACKSGYLRHNETSPCMPICKCPEIANTLECLNKTCGLYEEYVEEKQSCPPEICRSMVARYDCRNAPPPKPGCACKSGYLRHNETSPCMPICKCPEIANTLKCKNKTCGLNEEYVEEKWTCPPETCLSMVADYDCRNAPPPKPGCACKSGYLRRNETSPCIPSCQCSEISSSPECQKENCKDPNEKFVQEKITCPPDTCGALTARWNCSNEPPPQPGCTCKSGYRRLNDKCVPICECPQMIHSQECQMKTCDDPNEVYVQEKSTCPGDTCNALVDKKDCSNAPKPQPGCECKDGYRRLNDKCVPICECPEMASTTQCQTSCSYEDEDYYNDDSSTQQYDSSRTANES